MRRLQHLQAGFDLALWLQGLPEYFRKFYQKADFFLALYLAEWLNNAVTARLVTQEARLW